jgi:hypothetical protein
MLTALGSKEAEMKMIGCDLHAAQQTIAMLDRETGEIVAKTLRHQAGAVREFYAGLPARVVVGLEATGSMGWFLQLLDELGVTYRVGHPATIRKADVGDFVELMREPAHHAPRHAESEATGRQRDRRAHHAS